MVLPARNFTPGSRDFHPSDLEKLELSQETFGSILDVLEDGKERFDKAKREILLVQYGNLREYFVDVGVITIDGNIDEEALNRLTIRYISERIKKAKPGSLFYLPRN